MHEAQHRGLPCFSLLVKHLRPSRYTSSSLVSFLSSSITFSSSVCRSLLGAPDIYGIFLIARSLHSALLARSASSMSRFCSSPEDSGDQERFNLHYRRCQCGAHRAKLRSGFVAAFRDPPRYRDRRSRWNKSTGWRIGIVGAWTCGRKKLRSNIGLASWSWWDGFLSLSGLP